MPHNDDFLKRFARHFNYSQRALWWAEESIDLKKTGKAKAAARAEENAKTWLAKAIALEPSGLKFAPHRARSKF